MDETSGKAENGGVGVVEVPSGTAEVELRILSQPRYLAGARDMIDAVARRLGFDELNAGQIALAVDEALANVIRHGYDKRLDGVIWLRVWPIEGGEGQGGRAGLVMTVEDEAKQVDPSAIKSRELTDVRPGGLGVYLISQIMDASRWERREDCGMRLIMTKYVGGSSERADHAG